MTTATVLDLAEERRRGIGGTDVAAIVGLNPWKTAHDVWIEKVGLADPVTSEAAYWGTILEPIIGREYGWRESVEILRPEPRLLVHPQESWAIGHPDYLVASQPIGLDCKTTNLRQAPRWGDLGTDEIPEEALLQMQWYLALDARMERWDVAVLLGQEFRIYRVRPNRELQRMLIERCGEFWVRYVVPQTPPPVDHSDSARAMLQKVFPQDLGAVRPAARDEVGVAIAYRDVAAQLKALEETRDLLGNRLREMIGDDAGLEGDFGRITWKRARDGEHTDWKAVAHAIFNDLVLRLPAGTATSGLTEYVSEQTQTRPGVRRFLPKFTSIKESIHD